MVTKLNLEKDDHVQVSQIDASKILWMVTDYQYNKDMFVINYAKKSQTSWAVAATFDLCRIHLVGLKHELSCLMDIMSTACNACFFSSLLVVKILQEAFV